MKKRLLIAALLCSFIATAQDNKLFPVKNIAVKWLSLQYNYNKSNRTLGTFVIKNNAAKQVFPAGGWTIYFNSNRHINDTLTASGAGIKHYNGDIYTIVPGKDFKAIQPGDSVTVDFLLDRVILNATDKPYGLYIAWNNDAGKGYHIANYTAGPLSTDIPGYITPGKVYQQNSRITDIPEKELPPVFPTPANYRLLRGNCMVNAHTVVVADTPFTNEAGYLRGMLKKLIKGGKRLPDTGSTKVLLTLATGMDNEAYELQVQSGRIIISASGPAGMFYGIQSLLQMFPSAVWKTTATAVSVSCMEIRDAPRFGFRSLSLDVARHFKDKQTILKVLDLMARYKMNTLHFHLTDDEAWRIDIPGLPELTAIGAVRGHTLPGKNDMLPPSYGAGPEPGKNLGSGYYTRSDFIEILRYAAQRHIQVIPEIESPGHARAAITAMKARYEKLKAAGNKTAAEEFLLNDLQDVSVYSSAQEWTDNVMCVGLPSVYHFMEKVTDELIAMYREAGASLSTIHVGGDEVPEGVWERSPVCRQLLQTEPGVKNVNDLWLYYFSRMNRMLQSKGLQLSAWEEAGMRKTKLDGTNTMIVNGRFASSNMQLHVWNNVTGWGAEDLPYKLANAGFKVVLSPVSNNYLDLAYYRHPDEPGYYWGGFQDIDKPFYFIPFDYYKTSREDPEGNPVNKKVFDGKERLTDFGKSNIVGIEGLLWAENLASAERMEYMLLPKLLGVAERAWAPDPEWATMKDSIQFEKLYSRAWSVFLNTIGKKELPQLDHFAGGYQYRIPAPGITIEDQGVLANCQFPGLTIRYTADGTEPTTTSKTYTAPVTDKGMLRFKVFATNGRSSRTVSIENR